MDGSITITSTTLPPATTTTSTSVPEPCSTPSPNSTFAVGAPRAWALADETPSSDVLRFVECQLDGEPGLLALHDSLPGADEPWARVSPWPDEIRTDFFPRRPDASTGEAAIAVRTEARSTPIECSGGGVAWEDVEVRGARGCLAATGLTFLKFDEGEWSVHLESRLDPPALIEWADGLRLVEVAELRSGRSP